ncbi:MAG: DegT/DnrJ/EryC1/StrS family aminotransferase [bacterium]|nr:DegT/DnrJ/EryC1/StrS family aminotransferase [bacterium]
MQFIDLKTQQDRIRDKIETNIKKVLDHGKYIMGPEIKELEDQLAGYVGTQYGVGVASGTDALLMALMIYGIGPGDAVFTTPFTFIATAEVIRLLGATPVFADIQKDTYNIDPEKLETAIQNTVTEGKLNPKGIIPVDIFGQTADYDEIEAIAEKYGLFVVQDAAQSFGASYKNKKACSNGDVATTSFFPAKPLGGYGDGGMVFTDNPELYDKLVSIRNHGKGRGKYGKYDNIRVGINGRLDTIQAAVLLAKMEIFDEEIPLRQEVAQRYNDGLKNAATVPVVRDYNISVWAQYGMLHPQRDRVIEKLKEKGIPSAIYYPVPLHLQEAFQDLDCKKGDFPVSEECADTIFSIPMHPYLKKEDQDRIIEAICSV